MKKEKSEGPWAFFLLLFCFCRLFYCFCTKRLLLILLKNEENLVENTLQIYHNTMEGVLERLDDNLDLLLGYRLLFDTAKWRK